MESLADLGTLNSMAYTDQLGMDTIIEIIEPLLSWLREEFRKPEPLHMGAPCVNGDGRDRLPAALRACRIFLRIHCPSSYVEFDPAECLAAHATTLQDEQRRVHVQPLPSCVGDPEQIFCLVKVLTDNTMLGPESELNVELCAEADVPVIMLRLDGPGRFPEHLTVENAVPLRWSALEHCWTIATRGGRIDKTPEGLCLRLRGIRVVPEAVSGLEPVFGQVEEGLRALESTREGLPATQNEGPACSPEKAIEMPRRAIENALAMIDGDVEAKTPADLCAVLSDVASQFKEEFGQRGITIDTCCDQKIPPIVMRRGLIRRFFSNALRHAATVLPDGGAMAVLVDYDAAARAAGIIITSNSGRWGEAASFYEASLRRAIVEGHGGTVDVAADDSAITITVSLPDDVGRALDTWIPGFEVFCEQSKRMLRLLKSGGAVPPEDFVLGGVLEQELERWLLPRYASPAARNVAYELEPDNRGLAGSSPERLTKALNQIRRGRPRKEVAKPPYAAEILWAFRADGRHRNALGAQHIDKAQIETLCVALLATPPQYVTALRIIAQVLSA